MRPMVIAFPGTWYPFDASDTAQTPLRGPAVVRGKADLRELPAFVPAGSIVPLAPLVQHTDALPGGPLEVRVYTGSNARFELFEDDGETLAYKSGALRTTRFNWDDDKQELSWTSTGPSTIGFTYLFVKTFALSGVIARSSVVNFGQSGTVVLEQRTNRGSWGITWWLVCVALVLVFIVGLGIGRATAQSSVKFESDDQDREERQLE